MEEANERKRLKYQELVEECRRRGWKAHCELTEVGLHCTLPVQGTAVSWESQELQRGEPLSPPQRLQREPLGGFGSKGLRCGPTLLGHKPGIDHPG